MPGARRMRFAAVVCALALVVALPVAAAPSAATVEGWGWWSVVVERVAAWMAAVVPGVGVEKEGGLILPDGVVVTAPGPCSFGECTDEGGLILPDG